MSEPTPTVITDVPEHKAARWTSRLKAPAVKITATLAVVGLGAYALGRKANGGSCPCDTTDEADAGQTETV